MGPRYQTAEDGLGMPAGSAAVTGIGSIVDIVAESVATGTQRTSRWAEGISAGWAPAATSSATNCWGSVERDDGLADEDDIGAAAREAHDVVRAPDSSGCDPHDLCRQNVSDLIEHAAVNGQGIRIPGVDGDDAGARIDRGQRLTAGTNLNDGAHP